MELKKNAILTIAKSRILSADTELESLDHNKWETFVENNPNYFIWNEETDEGKEIIKNINNYSERIKNKLFSTLNKGVCFTEFNEQKKSYNISVTFYEELNWITIQFARTPKLEDLKIFVDMAKHLDALLLVDGTRIIDEKMIEEL
ncbi:hypothetical protein G6M26_06105 [Agrobacterium tumefaciens]|nr:hypothetical protein [Agrobacterium tumefaciens]NTE18089.1 hypothetical protein [Agrobacterium tumefaciens]